MVSPIESDIAANRSRKFRKEICTFPCPQLHTSLRKKWCIFSSMFCGYIQCMDTVADPDGVLSVNDTLKLVPGHCDPTCNVHDWYVGVRDGKVETLWPVSARGKAY